jgi:RHS repeat-associated protein
MLSCIARLCGLALSFVAVFCLCLTSVLDQGARAQGLGNIHTASTDDDHRGQGRPSKAVLQQLFVLDAANRRATHFGLEVLLPADYLGPLPVLVQVGCLSGSETPRLAVDAATYGPNARLLNRTVGLQGGCNAYQVAATGLQSPLVGPVSILSKASAAKGIAIGVHHAGPLPSAADKSPSIFVFNPVHGNWTEAKSFTPSAPDPQRAYATLSEPSQRIISGLIAMPEQLQSEPSQSAPESLAKPLEQINPISGYLGVDKIEPDSKGAYAVNLPLLLRPSRGAGPSFAVRYSPQGGPGVLGRSWDLVVSSVEVRGPAPVYHSSYETEDYVLDGMDLIALDANGKDIPSLYKGGPIIPRVAGLRTFRLRNNSGGLIVRRYGYAPDNYFWEVWDPNTHVTRLYGGSFVDNDSPPVSSGENGILRGVVKLGSDPARSVIGQWGLTAEYDNQPARNGALYTYAQVSAPSERLCTDHQWNGKCTPALRIRDVEYNRAFGAAAPASGITLVRFQWGVRDANRFNSDGRLGFLRAQEYLLNEIVVHYEPEAGTAWLAAADTGDPELKGKVLFARHSFDVRGDDACTNYDLLLRGYEVQANRHYDDIDGAAVDASEDPLAKQTFSFSYNGERSRAAGGCNSLWPAATAYGDLGGRLKEAPGGQLQFPAGLLRDLGFGLLTGGSLLGTSRSEETGASLYVGFGPIGDTSSKATTCCFKAGANFTKTEGNSTLVDVSGDGIDDLIFRDHGELRYCAGQRAAHSENGIYKIDYPLNRCGVVRGVSDFAISSSDTKSIGAEFYPYNSLFIGVAFNASQNENYVYFTDRDGDGLIDIVNYGRVLYNQGESIEGGRYVVRFTPRSALIPPIPNKVSEGALSARIPTDMRDSITAIEAKIEAASRALQELDFSQTVVGWEAPLTGNVALSGTLISGSSKPDGDNAGPFGPKFGPTEFDALNAKVERYQSYIKDRQDCRLWEAEEHCHADSSDPLGPHYRPTPRRISFIKAPIAVAKLWVYRRVSGTVEPCGEKALTAIPLDLATVTDPALCRLAEAPSGQIRMEAGDVLYLAYSIHPHFAAWHKPAAKIAYIAVDDDSVFNRHKAGAAPQGLPCRWKDQADPAESSDCLLAQQTRYEFDLRTGLIPTAPATAATLAPGNGRRFGGRLDIPADLARDYQVYFDVVGEPRQEPPPGTKVPERPNGAFGPLLKPAQSLPRLFRQDISTQCALAVGTCSVDIAPVCAPVGPDVNCDAFTDPGRSIALASRVTVLHRVSDVELPVRNISARLADLRWRIPPHVKSKLTEHAGVPPVGRTPPAPVGASKEAVVLLPVAMGEPDLEYVRVNKGTFRNPDTTLDDGDPRPEVIDFEEFVAAEPENVRLARLRQTMALCAFAAEIRDFLSSRYTSNVPPYTEGYGDYWDATLTPYQARCKEAKERLAGYRFTDFAPEPFPANTLQLPSFLRNLPLPEQLTSAETLLERVLVNLALGEDLLTDAPKLTRRGYRLPVKANPLDCGTLASGQPLDRPVTTPDGGCAYRLSTNFAMQDFEELVALGLPKAERDEVLKNMREVLGRFAGSRKSAFRIDLAATVNGRPVAFHELSGASTGNDPCSPSQPNSCLGLYGSRASSQSEIEEHFYQRQRAGEPAGRHGDVFQRITLNKRVGRAVAFSNGVMHTKRPPYCPRRVDYPTLSEMELKQDCPLPDTEKYAGPPSYVVSYTIGENNEFEGRNRVLEFTARPLDMLELHVQLSPIDETVARGLDPSVRGKFSIFDGAAQPTPGIDKARYLIPRAPSQILTPDDEPLKQGNLKLSCPQLSEPPNTGSAPLPTTCRPWTRLGWTELLLGAQYRTYSDAQRAPPGHKRFSILRRRDMLRLHPEIEVEADKFALVPPGRTNYPQVQDVPREAQLALYSRDPNVGKTGGDWSWFGARAEGQALRQPPAFFWPLSDSLRYGPSGAQDQSAYKPDGYVTARDACKAGGPKGHKTCGDALEPQGEGALALRSTVWFPLEHRFVGPVAAAAFDKALKANPSRSQTGVCAAEAPSAIASCWKGVDDTVFLETAVSSASGVDPDAYSVSGLIGFERPPVVRFLFEFESYRRLACIDPQSPSEAEGVCPRLEAGAADAAEIPNRPTPPYAARTIEIFAPVQSSRATSVSHNEGVALFNTHSIDTYLTTTRQFRDVNGDGYPDVISDGVVELTSPVGLSRRDWWTYFRVSDDLADPSYGQHAPDFDQTSHAVSSGAGIGLSAQTAAKFQPRGTRSTTSGSPDAAVDPSFAFSLERGHDEAFVELRDFNGDGLPDKLSGGQINLEPGKVGATTGLSLKFNVGSGLGAERAGVMRVADGSIDGYRFNTSHSSGFGVRLGFSNDSGSLFGGLGLSHRHNGSQAALIDFNGDGRPDIVAPVDGGLLVYPNLGNGFGPGRLHTLKDWILPAQELQHRSGTALSETTLVDAGTGFTFGFNAFFVRMVLTPAVKWARNQTRELLGIRDVNGDGVPDVVTVSGDFLPTPGGTPDLNPASLATHVHYNPTAQDHLLSGITVPSGASWTLRHALLGNSGPENGRPTWVLSAVARFDGYVPTESNYPPRGQNVLLTTYEYEGGYYNRAEHQFYGFDSRTTRSYGCTAQKPRAENCLAPVTAEAELDERILVSPTFRKLQVVHQAFSNRDFLTQGLEFSRTVAGAVSSSDETQPNEPVQAVSQEHFAYTIDNLNSLAGPILGQCAAVDRTPLDASWKASQYSVAQSRLGPDWDGTKVFPEETPLLGIRGICSAGVNGCIETLRQEACETGFVREQRAFWAQQSGSVRLRLRTLETFGGGARVKEPKLKVEPSVDRLRSAVAFDYDRWSQVVQFNSLGEAGSDWAPQTEASTNAVVSHARRQGLNAVRTPGGGYPLLGLVESLEVFAGPFRNPDGGDAPIRVREALYSDNRREGGGWKGVNLSDLCLYPGGEGFRFVPSMCAAFKKNMEAALADGYSTLQDALRSAYTRTAGLPRAEANFDAIVHHRLVDYDAFGNLLHTVSPLSRNKEWIERRFDYSGDPFRRTPTTVTLTRCVNDVPGAGADSADIETLKPEQRPPCTLGFTALPDPILRKPVSHRSHSRVDAHFGSVAQTADVNGNQVLLDVDRWGRLTLVARAWGNPARENRTLQDRVRLAVAKDPANLVEPATVRPDQLERWRVLAAVNYRGVEHALLRSNVRRFESSDAYSGLLAPGQTTRETATFADGAGRLVQSVREADVCVGAKDNLVRGMGDGNPLVPGLAERCTATATGIVTPGARVDALGRELASFEAYPIGAGERRQGSGLRFLKLTAPPTAPLPVVSTTYDGAGRPLLVASRLSEPVPGAVAAVKGAAQYRYRIVKEEGNQLASFEALSLSPRCTASAVWSDARGLRRTVFEDQRRFYVARPRPRPRLGDPPLDRPYQRDLARTAEKCSSIDTIAQKWADVAKVSAKSPGLQPARVSYRYDPLQQLTGVDSPLDGSARARIAVRFDLLGRTIEMQEPNSGCTRYEYDGLSALISETGFRHESDPDEACGVTSKVRNRKVYDYAAGRMIRMSYSSLEEQGGSADERDVVRLFYDRSPSAILYGTPAEAQRFVPNDQANQRFVDAAGRNCDNCIGKATVVADRTGARAYAFNELGLARREVRSVVGPLRDVKHSGGHSETYLPEIAFYELESSFTAFGDPVQERFSESAPTNPANACIKDGVNTCLSRFTIGRRYAPDGAVAQLTFNGQPQVSAAGDALGRPAVRWTASGIATGYAYDGSDLRLNRMTTLTASGPGRASLPVQAVGYQYDGGGNVLDYANLANRADLSARERYASGFAFKYDPVNRLTGFGAAARRGDGGTGDRMAARGRQGYDAGHRFTARHLSIAGEPGSVLQRSWAYSYGSDPREGPVHAPRSIGFSDKDAPLRETTLAYDDLGRMTRIRTAPEALPAAGAIPAAATAPVTPLLSNRAMTWDAEGRLLRVRGVKDGALPLNDRVLREEYVYDSGGNRTLKVHRPWLADQPGASEKEREAATLYLTSFYARPYDRRGTVQLSQGSLPAVSLAAPADPSEEPAATYLYADLPVGSMTAAVTVFGEPTDKSAITIARREYDPYGLELTTHPLAETGRPGVPPLFAFHGKELDRVTNFSSFGARYYSRDMGIWLKTDPMMGSYLTGAPNGGVFTPVQLSPYAFAHQRPAFVHDADGNFGVAGALIGMTIGVGVQSYLDFRRGELSSAGRYAGVALGGAIVGATGGLAGGALTSAALAVGAGAVGGAAAVLTETAVDRHELAAAHDVAQAAVVGAAAGAVGYGVGRGVAHVVGKASPYLKGRIGEAMTQVRELSWGNIRIGRAVVETGRLTRTGRPQAAHYDHQMYNLFTGELSVVESKFGTAGLTANQKAAQQLVSGRFLIDRTTAGQVGDLARGMLGSAGPAFAPTFVNPSMNQNLTTQQSTWP